jgi:[ribosomal protein S5]-alanine N-acetyltransferase
LLVREPRPEPWGAYIAWDGQTPIGTCAFKWAPDTASVVEVAYMTFPAFEGRGYAKAMIAALVEAAREGGARRVIAHTLPEENASNRALRRNGFTFDGDVIDPEDGPVWRWSLPISPV